MENVLRQLSISENDQGERFENSDPVAGLIGWVVVYLVMRITQLICRLNQLPNMAALCPNSDSAWNSRAHVHVLVAAGPFPGPMAVRYCRGAATEFQAILDTHINQTISISSTTPPWFASAANLEQPEDSPVSEQQGSVPVEDETQVATRAALDAELDPTMTPNPTTLFVLTRATSPGPQKDGGFATLQSTPARPFFLSRGALASLPRPFPAAAIGSNKLTPSLANKDLPLLLPFLINRLNHPIRRVSYAQHLLSLHHG
jgi:hypothetical protein